MKVTTAIRLILSITLLVFVWLNAHWSVAILLTLQGLNNELISRVAFKNTRL